MVVIFSRYLYALMRRFVNYFQVNFIFQSFRAKMTAKIVSTL